MRNENNKIYYTKIIIDNYSYYLAVDNLGNLVYLSPRNEGYDLFSSNFKKYILVENSSMFTNITNELISYLKGSSKIFKQKIKFIFGTDFQRSVWEKLLKIPYGKTTTYQNLAVSIGRPKAHRAVANAVGSNPLAIIVPCHRVIRSDGSLGGYSGGIDMKIDLLTIEGIQGLNL